MSGTGLTKAASAPGDGLSPALLGRARSLAGEHDRLSKAVAEDFDSRSARRVGELSHVTRALRRWEGVQKSLAELDSLLRDPSIDDELRALAADDVGATGRQLASAAQALTSSLVPRHPFAHLPCLVEIRPGAGGGEAAIFAGDLLRMYQAFCSRRKLRASLLKYEDGEGGDGKGSDAPLQEAILEVDAAGAYGELRGEAGVHRVQRVPATESKGRTHTSAASVLVLPSPPAEASESDAEASWSDPTSDYYVDPKDVRTDVMRARGAGGQHVNTTDSAVRLTHVPTGTVVSMQDSRSQPKNREKAWRLLRARLAQARREAREEQALALRRSVVGVARVGRGDKVRTYNWGQQRVTDHRSGTTVHALGDVMAGGEGLERLMTSVGAWLAERDLGAVMAEEGDAAGAGEETRKG
ncbi:MAG: hypothetical protein M1832_002579 [Thelocarpon impressellum]|nr:MAG: hypothetical protein M1832_002579 [Thelocarpon impressellum]